MCGEDTIFKNEKIYDSILPYKPIIASILIAALVFFA